MNHRQDWAQLDVAAAARALETDPRRGIDTAESAARLAKHGPNELPRPRKRPAWALFLDQFRSVLIGILLVAVGLSIALGENVEALAIAIIVAFAALLGFLQEVRAGNALEALERMASPKARVIRGGHETTVPAREVVPGDLLVIATGDRIGADGRLVEVFNLQADEASLTGESVSVEKHIDPLPAPLAIADRKNMIYAGTTVTSGRGTALVVATGSATEFGKIAGLLETVEKGRTPLEKNLDRIGGTLARTALAVVGVVAVAGILRGQPIVDMIVFGIALAVAVVPEALPAVVTISLAIGVQRMARRQALVRRLQAVETLGSVSVICSDKTGTLTRDEMTVRRILVSGRTVDVTGTGYAPVGEFLEGGSRGPAAEDVEQLLRAAALVSDAHVVPLASANGPGEAGDWDVRGDPTEGALVTAALKAGLDKHDLDTASPRVDEIPFSSEAKKMTTLHRMGDSLVAFSKGAPETILDSCSRVRIDGNDRPLDPALRNDILDAASRMAGDALRVLAVATRIEATTENAGDGMTLLGLFGLMDPPREEARTAITRCREAGIRPMMITGDHPTTAAAIARELGLSDGESAVTGAEIDNWTDDALSSRLREASVFARVSPAHKLRIVGSLQSDGHLVAMTGDGVNDAPALRKADIGVAMGRTGTDVSREAADMTLADDNFATIVAAVEEGRAIYENIRKYLTFLFSANLGEIVLLATATLIGWPLPLSAVQILFVNLATDGLPALALAVDPHDEDLMKRPPRDSGTGIFSRPIVALILVGGIWSGAANLALFGWALETGYALPRAMTLVLVSLVLTEFFKAYAFRALHGSVLKRPFANRWLNMAIAVDLLLVVAVVHIPFMGHLLQTAALPLGDWLRAVVVAGTILPVLEVGKGFLRVADT